MINNPKPTDRNKDRIALLERQVNALQYHLLNNIKESFNLAVEIANLTGNSPDSDERCIRLRREYETLNSLRPTNGQNRR